MNIQSLSRFRSSLVRSLYIALALSRFILLYSLIHPGREGDSDDEDEGEGEGEDAYKHDPTFTLKDW